MPYASINVNSLPPFHSQKNVQMSEDDVRGKLKILGCLLDEIRSEKKENFRVWNEHFFSYFLIYHKIYCHIVRPSRYVC